MYDYGNVRKAPFDIDHLIAGIMPQIYFTTNHSHRDIIEEYKLPKSLEGGGVQLLYAAIQKFTTPQE